MSRAKRIAPTRAPDVFRGLLPGDTVNTVYLYADGHCFVVFSRYLEDVRKSVSYAKQAETIGLSVHVYDDAFDEHAGKGRVVFWGAGVALLRTVLAGGATRLDCVPARNVEGKTPRAASVEFDTPAGAVVIQRSDDVNQLFYVDPEHAGEAFGPASHRIVQDTMLSIVETIDANGERLAS